MEIDGRPQFQGPGFQNDLKSKTRDVHPVQAINGVFKYFFVQVLRVGYSITAVRPQNRAHRRANNKQTVYTLEMMDVPSFATRNFKTA